MSSDAMNVLTTQPASPSMGCRVSGRSEGLALRGVFILILIPVGLFVLWRRRRR